MKIGELLSALKATGLDASFDDLRAMLWLAGHIRVAPQVPNSTGNASSPVVPAEPRELDRPTPPAPAVRRRDEPLRSIEAGAQADDPVQLFGDKPGQGGAARQVRVRGAPALTQQLALGRALRPLLRRRTGHGMAMDEQASAEHMAESGMPALVYRPVRERWFDLVLISEQMASMAAWQPVLSEFERLLLRLGGFRNVRSLELNASGAAPVLLHRDGKAVMPKTLRDRSGRTLVVVLSDCTSAAWHDGRMGEWLAELAGDVPVSVGHYLPRQLWPHTAVGFAELSVRGLALASATQKLHVRRPTWAVGEPGVVMPVFELAPATLGAWARMVASAGGAWSAAALVPLPGEGPDEDLDIPPDDLSTAELRMKQFRGFGGREALLLAAYCSAVRPLTPPVMRVIHSALVPGSGTVALAQVLLGGLLYPLEEEPDQARRRPDEVEYEFYQGLRELLSAMLTERDVVKVNLAVHEYLVQLSGTPFDFSALMADMGGTEKLPEAALPFARFARQHFGWLADGRSGRSREQVAALQITKRTAGFLFSYSDGSIARSWKHDSPGITEKMAEEIVDQISRTQHYRTITDFVARLVPRELLDLLDSRDEESFCELVLDRSCTQYRWERLLEYRWAMLFDSGGGSGEPPTRRRGLTRRLLSAPPVRRHEELDQAALVIGISHDEQWRALGESDFNADMMAALRDLIGGEVHIAEQGEAFRALVARPWRLVHLVELARPNSAPRTQTQKEETEQYQFLTRIFDKAGHMPELIFIDHVLATEIAPALIERGASVAIAMPRRADDIEQPLFAQALYKSLHDGDSLIEAVRVARRVKTLGMVDSTGVECYGDPDWHWLGNSATSADNAVLAAAPAAAGGPRLLQVLLTGVDENMGWLASNLNKAYVDKHEVLLHFLPRYAGHEELRAVFGGSEPGLGRWDAVLCVIGAEHRAGQPGKATDRYVTPAQERVYDAAIREDKLIIGVIREPDGYDGEDDWTFADAASMEFENRLLREQAVLRVHSREELVDAVMGRVDALRKELDTHGIIRRHVVNPPNASSGDGPPREPWVLVAGSGTKNALSKKFTATCTLLGSRLAQAGFRLITGGWRGTDEIVARGFAEELDRLAVPDKDRLLHVLPKGKMPAFKRGRIITVEKGDEYGVCTGRANYLVLLGGHGGTALVAQHAFNSDCVVLPLADTGGDARRIHASIRALEPTKRQENMSDDLLAALAQPAPPVGASVVKMISELERLRTNAI